MRCIIGRKQVLSTAIYRGDKTYILRTYLITIYGKVSILRVMVYNEVYVKVLIRSAKLNWYRSRDYISEVYLIHVGHEAISRRLY